MFHVPITRVFIQGLDCWGSGDDCHPNHPNIAPALTNLSAGDELRHYFGLSPGGSHGQRHGHQPLALATRILQAHKPLHHSKMVVQWGGEWLSLIIITYNGLIQNLIPLAGKRAEGFHNSVGALVWLVTFARLFVQTWIIHWRMESRKVMVCKSLVRDIP